MTKEEYCAGIIPLRQLKDKSWEMLLALHVKGSYWAFPKGHLEASENPFKAAERELFEEIDLQIDRLFGHPPLKEDFIFDRDGVEIHKFVTYYPALVKGEIKIKEPHEVEAAQWFSIPEAIQKITFDDTRKMLEPILPSLQIKADN